MWETIFSVNEINSIYAVKFNFKWLNADYSFEHWINK